MSRSKYSKEERVQAVKDYLAGTRSLVQICTDLGLGSNQTLYDWVGQYRTQGESFFDKKQGNQSYSAELKQQAVEDYLLGRGSLRAVCAIYNIRSTQQLRNWIMQYNSNMKLTDYAPKQEVYMAAAKRKTSMAERKVIVEYCISHNKDYKGTAEKYEVSYSQIYNWTRSYLSNGPEGLRDNRGHRKKDEELDELEKLRRENLRLKRQLEDERRAVELLKKVQELERGRYWEKENKNQNI